MNDDIFYIGVEILNNEYQIEIIQDSKDDRGNPVYGFGIYKFEQSEISKGSQKINLIDKEFSVTTNKNLIITYAFSRLMLKIMDK